MKWNKNKIVAHSFGQLRKAYKLVSKDNQKLRAQIVGSSLKSSIEQMFTKSGVTAGDGGEPREAKPNETCDVCGKVHEGGVKFEKPKAEKSKAERTSPVPVEVMKLLERNTLLEQENHRLKTQIENSTQTINAIHPWDQIVPPSEDNPLGQTARGLIENLRQYASELGRTDRIEISVTDAYQMSVVKEIDRLWGTVARHDLKERALRFIEEAVELVQACDLPEHMIESVMRWVYSRQKGPLAREVGGTMVTLAGLCSRISVSLPEAAQRELHRLSQKEPEEMRGRHNAKPQSIKVV